jgi:hypothetical protein
VLDYTETPLKPDEKLWLQIEVQIFFLSVAKAIIFLVLSSFYQARDFTVE